MDELLTETYAAERQHFWYAGLRSYVRPVLAEAVAGCDHPRLLDVGCGTGANLTLLEPDRAGPSFGLDLTWTGLRFAAALGHRRIVQAGAERIPFREASFDVVTSFDVLYCLEEVDERRAVGEMFRVLRPGGGLVVNVAAMSLLKGDHSVFDGEVRRYSRARLRLVLEGAGFTIVRITHTNCSIVLPMLAIRLLQRLRGLPPPGEARSDLAPPPALVNRLLATVLALEARVVRWVDLPVGSSILCLARKPAAA